MHEKFEQPISNEASKGSLGRLFELARKIEKEEPFAESFTPIFDMIIEMLQRGETEGAIRGLQSFKEELKPLLETVDKNAKKAFDETVETLLTKKEIFELRAIIASKIAHNDEAAKKYTELAEKIDREISNAARSFEPGEK